MKKSCSSASLGPSPAPPTQPARLISEKPLHHRRPFLPRTRRTATSIAPRPCAPPRSANASTASPSLRRVAMSRSACRSFGPILLEDCQPRCAGDAPQARLAHGFLQCASRALALAAQKSFAWKMALRNDEPLTRSAPVLPPRSKTRRQPMPCIDFSAQSPRETTSPPRKPIPKWVARSRRRRRHRGTVFLT